MHHQDDLDGLIGMLYEAALEPNLWHEALTGLLNLVDAQIGHLFSVDRRDGHMTSSIMWGPGRDQDEIKRGEADYALHFGPIDPRQEIAARAGVGEWIRCHQHFDDAFVRRSEFFNEYLIPYGYRYAMGARLGDTEEHSVFIGMHRDLGQNPFGEEEVRRIKRVDAHLARAARLFLKSEDLRMKLDSGLRALDALDFAVMIVDQAGLVRFANSTAEELLRRKEGTLAMRKGRLVHTAPSAHARFETLLRDAVMSGRGGGMRLTPDWEHASLHLLVVPLSPRSRLAAPWQIPLALVFVSNPMARRMLPAHTLGLLFGLSPAEARLAEALVQGFSPGEYAASAGVSLNTVRTQIRSLFDKTGCRRLAELVKLLSSLPAVRLEGDVLFR